MNTHRESFVVFLLARRRGILFMLRNSILYPQDVGQRYILSLSGKHTDLSKVLFMTIAKEFHTHPDGMEELNINDRRILKKLGRGFWIIVTPEKVVPWYSDSIDRAGSVLEKPKLEIVSE